MRSPILYEVNTRCWLRELSEQAGRRITLAEIPDHEIQRWVTLGFTHIWLMGVWQVGERARAVALESWQKEWKNQIPSEQADVHGSPFAIRDYSIDTRLGEPISLLLLKERFAEAGLNLILDFIPNHLGVDSPEPLRYPARFVQAEGPKPGTFACETKAGRRHLAHGRDPYFAPWIDTVQLDYRVAETHHHMAAVAQTMSMFGSGLRCDMAMLLLPEIFTDTWKEFPCMGAHRTGKNFWRAAIPAIRQLQPNVDLIAEVYWEREQELQDLGFDFTYNKRVCDFIMRGQFAEMRAFLLGCPPQYLRRSVHFLENHDEQRAATALPLALHKAAALLLLALPGMALLHDGQLEGRRQFARIQMSKRADEEPDREVAEFYQTLLTLLPKTYLRRGKPALIPCERTSALAVAWAYSADETDIAVVNLSPNRCLTRFPWPKKFSTTEVCYQTVLPPVPIESVSGGIECDLPPESAAILRLRG